MKRVAIVDPSEASRESLRTLILGVDSVWLDDVGTRYDYFPEVVRQSKPDLVIVNLDSDKSKSLILVSLLVAENPLLPIVTISSDSQILLQSLQRGARFFLTPPVGLEDLVSTLRKALTESGFHERPDGTGRGAPSSSGQIISVIGSCGGVGTTSLAVNLACSLAANPLHNVALLDLDLALGDADIVMEVPNGDGLTLGDLARNIERLDMNYLKRALVKHPETGVSVLRHPLELHEVGSIHEGHIERILNLLKISYTHLVCDLSKALLPTDLMALRMADLILLVCQLELSSLRNVVRMVHSLGTEAHLGENLRVVVNRAGSEQMEGGISIKKAEEVIGKPIFWQVPNDTKPMMAARANGVPLIRCAPKARAHQAILGLAQSICGKPVNQPEVRKRGWFS